MANLSDIKSTNWQIATDGAGIVAEGLADIRQCIDVTLRTSKGTDALRPQFGSDIHQYIDKPVNISIPNIKKAIIEALGIWEKRVKLVRITHKIIEENVQFFIYYSLVDEDITDEVQLYLRANDVILTPAPPPQANPLILRGDIPDPYQQLMIRLVLNEAVQQPEPPVYGFSTPQQMYNWAVANWGFIGAWYLRPTAIYLYVNRGFATSGFIEVLSLALNKYVFPVPTKMQGQEYLATVTKGELRVGSIQTDNLGAILDYLNSTQSAYGQWVVEQAGSTAGDFSPVDFNSDDFNTVNTLYQFALLTTDNPAQVQLTITLE